MAEPAVRRMSVDEFLDWDDGSDTRYELIDGFVVAMAPPGGRHGLLSTTLSGEIRSILQARRPCRIYSETGVFLPDRNDTFYVADLAATCVPLGQDGWVRDPFLLIEILSPSTTRADFQRKVPDYRRLASVQEVLLIDSLSLFAEVHRRDGEQWITEIVRGASGVLTLNSVPLRISMSQLYDGVPLSDDEGQPITR
jgi:Uma2 family endonuclease